MPSFGITSAIVGAQITGLALDDTNEPTNTTVTATIARHGAVLSALLESRGVDPTALTSSDNAYHLCSEYVLKRTLSDTVVGRTQWTSQAESYDRKADEIYDLIKATRMPLGDAASGTTGTPGRVFGDTQLASSIEDVEDASDQSLFYRARRTLDF